MKTPIQELKYYLEEYNDLTNEDLHLKTDSLLEKEKQMVIDAFKDGIRKGQKRVSSSSPNDWIDSEQYFNEKYKLYES